MGRRVVLSELPLLLAAPVCHEMVTARDRNQAVRCDDVNIFPLPTDTYYHYNALYPVKSSYSPTDCTPGRASRLNLTRSKYRHRPWHSQSLPTETCSQHAVRQRNHPQGSTIGIGLATHRVWQPKHAHVHVLISKKTTKRHTTEINKYTQLSSSPHGSKACLRLGNFGLHRK